MRFTTGEDFYQPIPGIPTAEMVIFRGGPPVQRPWPNTTDGERLLEWAKRLCAEVAFAWPETAVDRPEAFAYVNHGRWCVDCPFHDCYSSQYAFETDRRFYCINCQNAAVGHAFIPVVWPGPDEAAEIESALSRRPASKHMNWTRKQTVQDLVEKNLEMGVA